MHKIDFDMDKTVHRRIWSLKSLEESVGDEGKLLPYRRFRRNLRQGQVNCGLAKYSEGEEPNCFLKKREK